jgi:hypothetical protein
MLTRRSEPVKKAERWTMAGKRLSPDEMEVLKGEECKARVR